MINIVKIILNETLTIHLKINRLNQSIRNWRLISSNRLHQFYNDTDFLNYNQWINQIKNFNQFYSSYIHLIDAYIHIYIYTSTCYSVN